MKRILIVGGGLSGGMVKHFINKVMYQHKLKNVTFDLWEMESVIGGRMRCYQFQDHEKFSRVDLVLTCFYHFSS
jgi:protoporphyrinogen oxidase